MWRGRTGVAGKDWGWARICIVLLRLPDDKAEQFTNVYAVLIGQPVDVRRKRLYLGRSTATCSGLIEPDTSMRDNSLKSKRCPNDSETNKKALFE